MPRLHDFEGEWRLARRIEDAGAPGGRLDGIASFQRGQGGLIYEEESELRLPGAAPMRATRRYLWRGDAAIEVSFADGRVFHSFDAEAARPEGSHPCGQDLYRVVYEFSSWPAWRANWTVEGPRKRLSILSDYRPQM